MEYFYKAQQNLSSLHKIGRRPAEKNWPVFFQHARSWSRFLWQKHDPAPDLGRGASHLSPSSTKEGPSWELTNKSAKVPKKLWNHRSLQLYIDVYVWNHRNLQLYIDDYFWKYRSLQLYIDVYVWNHRSLQLYIDDYFWNHRSLQLYIDVYVWKRAQLKLGDWIWGKFANA
jgi:hypothetical protein